MRTEDNKIKVFIESRDFTEHDKSDVILEQRWKLLHSNQVRHSIAVFWWSDWWTVPPWTWQILTIYSVERGRLGKTAWIEFCFENGTNARVSCK